MAAVNRICADHGIDLDEDSETSPSQNCRNDADEEEFIDLEDLIGKTTFLFSYVKCNYKYSNLF